MRLSRLLAALLLPAAAAAQSPPRPLTLQDAIRMAQEQGPAAQVARSNRDAAHYRDDAFNARLLPQLYLRGDAMNLFHGINAQPLDDGSTQFIRQSQNESSLQLGFSQRIPLTGGTVSVGSEVSRIDLFGDLHSRSYQTTPVVLSLQQDLFKPRTVVWDRRVQALDVAVAERGYLESREDVAAQTADAFFNLYAQEVALRNASFNAAVNDTLYLLNKGRFEVGKIGENDLLKSELALLRARASADDAKLARDRAEAALRRIIVYPAGEPMVIATPDSIPVVNAAPDVAVREALRNSSTIRQNDLDVVQSRRAMSLAKANNRFNASLQGSVGFNQTAPQFGQAYQSPLGKQTLQMAINLPMLQWGAGHADIQEAKAIEERVGATNKMRRDALEEDARFSVLQLEQAKRNVTLAAKADTVAQRQFEVARNRYSIGKISNEALYLAQGEKDAAVLANVQALRNYWITYYHLRKVTLYDFEKGTPLIDDR
jgi:outer membrane protein TolC